MKKDNKKEKIKKFYKNKLFYIIILVIIILLLLFGTRVYLLVNYLLGNDLLIRITPDKTNIFLKNNEKENLTIKTEIFTNPFCSVICNYSFIRISNNMIVDSDSIRIKPTFPLTKKYIISSPEKGIGQELYRFDIRCIGTKSLFCHTNEELISKIILITLNYELDENNEIIKNITKEKILSTKKKIYEESYNYNLFYNKIIELNDFFDNSDNLNDIALLNDSLTNLNNFTDYLKKLWELEEYNIIEEKNEELNNYINLIEKKIYIINTTIYLKIIFYNDLIDNITKLYSDLKELQSLNLSNNSLNYLDILIKDLNNFLSDYNKEKSMYNKEREIYSFFNKIKYLKDNIEKEKNENMTFEYKTNELIYPQNISRLNIVNFSYNPISDFILNEPKGKCCLFGNCSGCCDESCSKDSDKYPIILIHGHAFSNSVSSEYNLNSFDLIQRELEKNGYLNTGSIYLGSNDKKGIWGYSRYPISVRASYYFDNLKTKSGSTVLQTKQDNIDTYSIRLNDIIKTVKFKTNRDKVIVITHSMGGLVLRRYLQVFGENDIKKAILISSPNKGIDKDILRYCLLFGSELECNDMYKDSLFINNLNFENIPSLPFYNIIGIGCKTGNETGDGIIKNSSAYLEFAKNYYINGTCNELTLDYFHQNILNPKIYPDVYYYVNLSLNEE